MDIFTLDVPVKQQGDEYLVTFFAMGPRSGQPRRGDQTVRADTTTITELGQLDEAIQSAMRGHRYREFAGMPSCITEKAAHLTIPAVNGSSESNSFIISGIGPELILGPDCVDDPASQRFLASDIYYAARETFRGAHPGEPLPAGLCSCTNRFDLDSTMSAKQLRLSGSNILALAFCLNSPHTPSLVEALTTLCVTEQHTLLLAGGCRPCKLISMPTHKDRDATYASIKGVNAEWLAKIGNEKILVRNIALSQKGLGREAQRNIADAIPGCEGFFTTLRHGRETPKFTVVARWTPATSTKKSPAHMGAFIVESSAVANLAPPIKPATTSNAGTSTGRTPSKPNNGPGQGPTRQDRTPPYGGAGRGGSGRGSSGRGSSSRGRGGRGRRNRDLSTTKRHIALIRDQVTPSGKYYAVSNPTGGTALARVYNVDYEGSRLETLTSRMSFGKQRSHILESLAWEDVAKWTEVIVGPESADWYNAHCSHLSTNLSSASSALRAVLPDYPLPEGTPYNEGFYFAGLASNELAARRAATMRMLHNRQNIVDSHDYLPPQHPRWRDPTAVIPFLAEASALADDVTYWASLDVLASRYGGTAKNKDAMSHTNAAIVEQVGVDLLAGFPKSTSTMAHLWPAADAEDAQGAIPHTVDTVAASARPRSLGTQAAPLAATQGQGGDSSVNLSLGIDSAAMDEEDAVSTLSHNTTRLSLAQERSPAKRSRMAPLVSPHTLTSTSPAGSDGTAMGRFITLCVRVEITAKLKEIKAATAAMLANLSPNLPDDATLGQVTSTSLFYDKENKLVFLEVNREGPVRELLATLNSRYPEAKAHVVGAAPPEPTEANICQKALPAGALFSPYCKVLTCPHWGGGTTVFDATEDGRHDYVNHTCHMHEALYLRLPHEVLRRQNWYRCDACMIVCNGDEEFQKHMQVCPAIAHEKPAAASAPPDPRSSPEWAPLYSNCPGIFQPDLTAMITKGDDKHAIMAKVMEWVIAAQRAKVTQSESAHSDT